MVEFGGGPPLGPTSHPTRQTVDGELPLPACDVLRFAWLRPSDLSKRTNV